MAFGIDQRLIALNVHDQLGILEGRRHFRHPIGAGNMVGARHLHAGAEAPGFVADPLVVGGDDHAVQIAGHRNALVNVLEHGAGIDLARALPGKRDEAYRAGITPRIFRGTRDLTTSPLC